MCSSGKTMHSLLDTLAEFFCFCEKAYTVSNTKQKIVMKVQLTSEKSRTKALKIAVKAKGVSKVSIEVEKEQVEVIGNGVDAVCLAKSLQKKLGFANIVSVEEVKKEEKEEKPALPIQWTSSYIHYPQCHMYYDGSYRYLTKALFG